MNRVRIPVIIIFLIISTALVYYFRVVHSNEVIFTHFFYIPVILSAFWWHYRTVYVVSYLASALFFSDLYNNNFPMMFHDSIRGLIFLLVGLTVAFLQNEKFRLVKLVRYRQIISSMQEPVAIADPAGDLILKNEKFASVFPFAVSDIRSFKEVMAVQDFDSLMSSLNDCFEKGNIILPSYIRVSQSEHRYYKINFSPLTDSNSGVNIILTFWDVTERKRAEERLNTALQREKLVVDVLDLLNKQNPEHDAIKEILGLVKKGTGIEALGIILHSEEKFILHEMIGAAGLDEIINAQCALINGSDPGPGMLCQCQRSLELYNRCEGCNRDEAALFWSNDLPQIAAEEGVELCSCLNERGFRSTAVIPFSDDDGLLGFFILFDSRGSFFTDELIEYYKGVVQSVGIALSRRNYEANLRKTISEKEHLIREVHHRVKNNMQVITSLISLQTSRQTDENIRSVLNDCQSRVRAMALVHERLYNSNNFNSINFQNYIQTLVPMLMNTYRVDRQKIRVEINVSDISIGLVTAIPLAQLINELLSNSFKHAFRDSKSGNVEISLSRSDGDRNYSLVVSDDGCGLQVDTVYPSMGNLGFQLIDALIKQLRGKLQLNSEHGLSFTITFTES